MALTWGHPCLEKRLEVNVDVFPPDRRKRDLDNLLKICLDALQEASLFKNDSQIDKLTIERRDITVRHGEIWVHIQER
jgi:crossover junction endodeoxyribonuclease RusA